MVIRCCSFHQEAEENTVLTSILQTRLVSDVIAADRPVTKLRRQTELAAMAAAVKSKIEEGNIKAALRTLSSEDKPAADNEATVSALKARHPAAAPDRRPFPPTREFAALHGYRKLT
jgi:hypothetical protein